MEVLSNPSYSLKFVFRVLHIVPVVILTGKIINDYVFGSALRTSSKQEGRFYMIMGILLIVSGFINTFLLKPKQSMKSNAKIWIGWHHLQLLVSLLLLTPILNKIVPDPATVLQIRFYFVSFLLISSPFMRYYREYYSSNEYRRVGS